MVSVHVIVSDHNALFYELTPMHCLNEIGLPKGVESKPRNSCRRPKDQAFASRMVASSSFTVATERDRVGINLAHMKRGLFVFSPAGRASNMKGAIRVR